jgi:dihydroorotate dehydrogenase electron transfer subunit
MVAGGIGSAPFPALVSRLSAAGFRPSLFYGARTSEDLPLLEWFRDHCSEVTVSTEDGSLGHRGLVTEPLATGLERHDPNRLHVYACGPHPMLRAVARWALTRGIRCDVSLEARMACGFGVCLGCVVHTRSGESAREPAYERVCVEGPVMPAERVVW